MFTRKETDLTRPRARDPLGLLHELSDVDRWFEPGMWPVFPAFRTRSAGQALTWFPEIDVFERDQRLVTRIDLPGLKKEDLKIEVTEQLLTISGERRREFEDRKEHVYRCEREYGRFVRTVPLPQGVAIDDVKATFLDGVLEVTMPLPAQLATPTRAIRIEDDAAGKKDAA
jgi:HSP20 family protein